MKKIFLTHFIIFIYLSSSAQDITPKFNSAVQLYEQNNFAEAYKIFDSIIEEYDAESRFVSSSSYYAASCLFKLGQIEGSISGYEVFIDRFRLSSFRERALYELGIIYYQNKRFFKTREKLQLLLNQYPDTELKGSCYYWIGKSYQNEQNFIDAETSLLEAVSLRQLNKFIDYTLYSLGNLYEMIQRYDEAVIYYDELLSYYRDSELLPFAQLRIGASYYKLNEYDKAVLELSDPSTGNLPPDLINEAQYLLASSFFKLKEYENAQNTYQKILSKYTDEKIKREVEYSLAWISFQMREYEESYRMFQKLAVTEEDSIAENSFYWSAECLRYLNRNENARDTYQAFIEKYPSSKLTGNSNFSLGIIEYNSKKFPQAERYLLIAANTDDDIVKGKAYSLLGEISLSKNNYEQAKEYFQNSLKHAVLVENISNNAILGSGIAEYYLQEYEKAIADLSDLSSRQPGFEKSKVNFYLAESYFALKNYETAIKHYHRTGDDDEAIKRMSLYGRAFAYFNMKDYPNAAFYFREFIRKYRNDKNIVEAKLRLADSYFGMKEFNDAGEIYTEIFSSGGIKLDNDFGYYQYAQSLYKSGQLNRAVEEFSKLQKRYPDSRYADDSQYLIGWINFQQNDFREAISNYKKIFSEYPRSTVKPIAIYSIGDSYYNMGEYDSALVNYKRLINEYANTRFIFDAVNGIQYCYMAMDEPDKAVDIIDEFITDNPGSEMADEILMKKGEIFYSIGKYEKAVESYKEFILLYAKSKLIPEAYYWLAKSSSLSNNKQEAIENFKVVTGEYIGSKYGVDAVIELGDVYESDSDYKTALELYNTSLQRIKDENRKPEVMYEKAMALISLKDFSAAYSSLNEIINYYDGTLFADKAKIELSLIEIARSEFENAESLLKELGVKRLDDIGAQAQYLYGVVLMEQGKTDDAISALVRVRSVFSNYDYWYSKSLIALGDCYKIRNDKKSAREMYRAVIQKHSKDELGAEARQKLNKL
ncbi:MAG: tetratricopeptide repeat protein [Melioribacteraceae bacterium]|nr:tetratricopeptide repeat protein [Melioribacteraceae bacterium]